MARPQVAVATRTTAAQLACLLALSTLVRGLESDFNHTEQPVVADDIGDEGEAEEGIESLLHWAISNSDPESLRKQALAASGGEAQKLNLTDLKELADRRQKVREAIEAFASEPTEAELIKEAIALIENYLLNWAEEAEDLDAGSHAASEARSDDHAAAIQTVENALLGMQILCEPIDNANDLTTMGGLAPVVRLLSDVRPLRIGAAAVIATAASNNPTFQGELLRQQPRAMGLLVSMLSSADGAEASKGLTAVASTVRNLREAQESFLASGGLDGLSQLMRRSVSEGDTKLASRCCQLATDLVAASQDFLPRILQGDMPAAMHDLLKVATPDLDILEKTLFSIESMAVSPAAALTFRDRGTVEALQEVEAALLAERRNKSGDDTEYLDEVIEMARSVSGMLSAAGQRAAQKDEL
eukprot:jgi/Tetstr1/426386/TSEL_016698.t1